MNEIKEKISKTARDIYKNWFGILDIDDDVVIKCINPILTVFIHDIIKNKTIDVYQEEIINFLMPKIIKIKTPSLMHFSQNIFDFARENSHGATRLARIFYGKDQNVSVYNNSRIPITLSDKIESGTILGICEARFDGIAPESLIYQGLIAKEV